MSIQVTCPGCLTRFQVNDKFAGKKGPCPKCKAQIAIPEKGDEVVVHAPEEMGPKDSKGRSVLKPLARQEVRVTRWGIAAVLGAVLLAILAAVGLRLSGDVPLEVRIAALLALAPPLVMAGYSFARDSELAPYRGRELWLRAGIVSLALAACWMIYAFVPAYLFELDHANEMEYWLFGVTMAIMLVVGAFVALAAFELEFGGGLTISALYFVSTLTLAVIAGVSLAGQSVS